MPINELSENNVRTIAFFYSSEDDFRRGRPSSHQAARVGGYLSTLKYSGVDTQKTIRISPAAQKGIPSVKKKAVIKKGGRGDPKNDQLYIEEVNRHETLKENWRKQGYDYRYTIRSLGFNAKLRGHELKVTSNLDFRTLKPTDRLK